LAEISPASDNSFRASRISFRVKFFFKLDTSPALRFALPDFEFPLK